MHDSWAAIFAFSILVLNASAQTGWFELNWESGFPDGTPNTVPGLEPSFSFNGDSRVSTCSDSTSDIRRRCECGYTDFGYGGLYSPYKCDFNYPMSDIHYHEVLTVEWAREGTGVLKVYADGRDEDGSGDTSFRSELGAVRSEHEYVAGEEIYWSASFWAPSQYWDAVTLYSTIITQWKYEDSPHGTLRLSNYGDYKLYYKSGNEDLWEMSDDPGDPGAYLGVVKKDAWNDVKIYYLKSLGSDGRLRIYLNGAQVFEHHGRNLLSTDRGSGYVKFGLYTEIRDERVIYFDAVSYNKTLPPIYANEAEWVASSLDQPTVSLSSSANGADIASGAVVNLMANASDPGGIKLGTAGRVIKVEFFVQDNCLIAVDMEAPYSASWIASADGLFQFTAKATDEDGNVAVSSIVYVQVGSRPPWTMLTFPSPGNLPLNAVTSVAATATSVDGTVESVEFFVLADGDSVPTSIGIDSTPSGDAFEVSWTTPSTASAYTVYSVATDDAGKQATSAYVGITVGAVENATTLVPTDDASLKARTSDRDANSDYAEIEVFARPETDEGPQAIFGVLKIDASSLASAAEIRSAKLKVYANGSPFAEGNFSVWSTTGADDWAEDSVTWNNGPRNDQKISVTRITEGNRYWEFDVTSFLDAKVKAGEPLSGLSLWLQGDEGDYEKVNFDSKRADQPFPPSVEVTFSDVAFPTTRPPAPSPSPCPSGSGHNLALAPTRSFQDYAECVQELDWAELAPLESDGQMFTGGLGRLMTLEFEVWVCIRSHACLAAMGIGGDDHMCFIYNELTSEFVAWGFNSELLLLD